MLPWAAETQADVAARTLGQWVTLHGMPPAPDHLDDVAHTVLGLVGGAGFPLAARRLAAWWAARPDARVAALPADDAAQVVVEAVHHWPAANPVTRALGGPDWWA